MRDASPMDGTTDDGAREHGSADGMTDDEKRRDQLLRLSGSTESDAAPRIEVSEHDGATRIDVADTAAVRPGDPAQAEDAAPTGES